MLGIYTHLQFLHLFFQCLHLLLLLLHGLFLLLHLLHLPFQLLLHLGDLLVLLRRDVLQVLFVFLLGLVQSLL